MTRNLLTIAGYDPSGGAGAGLDIRVFNRLGFKGFGVLTSVTAQNSIKVTEAVHLPSRLVQSQYMALRDEVRLSGIKVGMTGTLENLAAAARILAGNPSAPRVVDPVFRSSSGARLIEKEAAARYLELLRGVADLLTPNLEEASALARLPVRTVADMKRAAERIFELSRIPSLVKGGHLPGGAVDVLCDGARLVLFSHPRVRKNVHGTGCFLSAAILGYLARGSDLKEACRRGVGLTVRAISEAIPSGKGRSVFAALL
jgi:hydroxymethylpyrimidine/phosphomethylpyrimidine kinase